MTPSACSGTVRFVTRQTLRVRNGSIVLPKQLQKLWRGAEVFVLPTADDTLVIKRVQEVPFWRTWRSLRKVGRGISQQDIDNAVRWARRR